MSRVVINFAFNTERDDALRPEKTPAKIIVIKTKRRRKIIKKFYTITMGVHRIIMKKNVMGSVYINGSPQENTQITNFSQPFENSSITPS